MQQLVLIFHFLFAIGLIVLVVIQRGKGAGMGAAFGSGASQTVFGSKGSGSFLVKVTLVLGALFFASSIGLTYLASQQAKESHSSNFISDIKKISEISKSQPVIPTQVIQPQVKKPAIQTSQRPYKH